MNTIQTRRATEPATTERAQSGPHYVDDTLTPPVDVVEDAQGITLYADLPGVPRDQLRLEVAAGTLTIEGQVQLTLPEGLQSSHSEVAAPRLRRVFTLSKELDTEQVSAELAQGVLTLRIPKATHAQARRIDIRVG